MPRVGLYEGVERLPGGSLAHGLPAASAGVTGRVVKFACSIPIGRLMAADVFAAASLVSRSSTATRVHCWQRAGHEVLLIDALVASMPAHLAGALGVPVWTLLVCPGGWRWLEERQVGNHVARSPHACPPAPSLDFIVRMNSTRRPHSWRTHGWPARPGSTPPCVRTTFIPGVNGRATRDLRGAGLAPRWRTPPCLSGRC